MRAVLILIASLVFAGFHCTRPSYDFDYKTLPDPRNKELVLGVGDTISINVWEQKDLNTEATIRPDGTITMPLVGDLKAAGATPSTLKAQIKAKLIDFVKLQQGSDLVTVAVKDWKSYRWTVQGEVVRQGVYTSNHFVTVADAIAMAGGLSRFAKRGEVKLFRADGKNATITIPLDYDALSSGKRLDMNVWVLSDDVIYVP
jgi:polysaccharide biosynthesis/export protein